MSEVTYGILEYAKTYNIEDSSEIYRIIERKNTSFILRNQFGEIIKADTNNSNEEYVVGDYVRIAVKEKNIYLTDLCKRSSLITRASSSTKKSFSYNSDEQLLAANVDQIFILISADQRFTLSKFERYLLTFNCMAEDIKIIISKTDFIEKTDAIKSKILEIYPNIKIYESSIFDDKKMKNIAFLFLKNQTSVLIGASGAGKSTLINYLIGEQATITQEVRSDGKGKHTTTSSSLFYLDRTSSYIIDTPGFKTISTHRKTSDKVLFDKIYNLSKKCKFNDCNHINEPGCAIQKALDNGTLSPQLYERYLESKEKSIRYEKFLKSKSRNKKKKKKMKIITNSGVKNKI
ncbi:ribosome small subunit-dependent GTPase A [Facklamia miroungae]|uniref:Small ribosomal subunit biogenesis GTPase RsgA n=1 Tax=Facklamia miroungae TaxID=120956 RepID=A0A1G7VCA6_9LACT|nr:ribosome small subunit-dependent GTPase A [Facklamia miroungae]NKZ30296.1 ribosome small subunit-dependent GTPase A [Facklamia miroungae]SDG57475.1 ribosome biogenesis GTPase [Facklamia miroungae]